MQRGPKLKNFLDLDVLLTIQESFSTATGLGTVFADEFGNEIEEGSNYARFCKELHATREGREYCRLCNYHSGIRAHNLKRPFIYECHARLIDIAVPIIVNEQYMGAMMAGQVKCSDGEFMVLEKMPCYYDWLANEDYKKLYMEVEAIPQKRIEAAAETLFVVVNFIVEKKIAEITQEKLNRQNEKLIKEIKIRTELEKSLKEAKLQALQKQINPHFMFNVLNTLSVLIRAGDFNTAQKVLQNFTKMLRYTMHNIGNTVDLEKEISYVKQYLALQKIRFGDRFVYEINTDPELNLIRLPFFTLQPLVENAIIHGLEPKETDGKISITAKIENDKIQILIKDNGVGIPKAVLPNLLDENHFDINEDRSNKNIGIINVHKRLKLYYGDKCQFSIFSKENCGTTVTLLFDLDIKER